MYRTSKVNHHLVCCVRGCSSKRQDVKLHKVPLNKERLRLWLKCLHDSETEALSLEQLSKLHVCHKHFEKRFVSTRTSHLHMNAYPSLFTADEISTGIPNSDIENVDPAPNDHTYSKKRHFDHTYTKLQSVVESAPSGGLGVVPSTSSSITFEPVDGSNTVNTDGARESPKRRRLSVEFPLQELMPGLDVPSTSCISFPPVDSPQSVITDVMESPKRRRVENHSQGLMPDTNMTPSLKVINPLRRRIVNNISKMTPKCKLLYREYVKAKRQLNFKSRAQKALLFCKKTEFKIQMSKMNPLAKKILTMQLKLCTKKEKGRRFTTEEKMIALSIMKQSPKCYRFLHKIFILPSKTTLNKMVGHLNLDVGINDQINELLKKEVENWTEKKKYCTIIFDEMALEPALTYNQHKDQTYGFVELTESTNKFADHALVFMVRGAVHNWQQPLAYYFCEGATSGIQLKKILKEIVKAVVHIGLKPLALVCDQGAAFQSALNSLKQDTRREQILTDDKFDDTITIHGINLSIIYDPCHLIKGLRNNFLTKDIQFEGKIAKWEDIVNVYKTDCNNVGSRLLHKLTDEYILPEKIKKMKVKNCVRVFSKSMVSAMAYTSEFGTYSDGRPC